MTPAGQGDDRYFPTPRLSTNASCCVQPVQPRHSDVHQDYLGQESLCRLKRLCPVVRRPDLVAQEPKHQGQAFRSVPVVVYHENATRWTLLRKEKRSFATLVAPGA